MQDYTGITMDPLNLKTYTIQDPEDVLTGITPPPRIDTN